MEAKNIRIVVPEDFRSYTAKATPLSNIWQSGECLKQVYQQVGSGKLFLVETPRNSNYHESAEEISEVLAAKLIAKYGLM